MKIRKFFTIAAVFCAATLCIGGFAYAENNTREIPEDLGTYTMSEYAYYPETNYDEMITDWMNRYDELVRPDKPNYFWDGTKQEALDIHYTFLTRFGYSEDISLVMAIDKFDQNHYYLSFKPNLDIDKSISSYLDEFQLTVNAAKSTDAASKRETAQNIYEYVRTNVSSIYDTSNVTDLTYYLYHGLSGRQNVCEGNALIFNRMCYMNGIQSEIAYGRYKNQPHGWNKVVVEDGSVWYDSATNHSFNEALSSDYEVYYYTPKNGYINNYIDYQ